MAAATAELLAFNRGRISAMGLARTDFRRTPWSAEISTNWLVRALGAMSLRPGFEYTGASLSNQMSVTIPFIKKKSDTARLEMTNGAMRVWVDDELVTRPAVTAAVTNGGFDSDLTGWTDADSGSAVSTWASGQMSLVGAGTAAARRRQQVTVNEVGVVHALAITVNRGPVILRVGSTSGGDDYVGQAVLGAGSHNIAFTPTGGSFWVELANYHEPASLVDSVNVASSGTMTVATPWAESDLRSLRWDQSGDVVFVACEGHRQHRVERRNNNSWSVIEYLCDNGPFQVQNVGPVTITPSATSGDITLTSSQPYFASGHIGALFRLTQQGQSADVELTGEDQWSDPIRVVGVDGSRVFAVIATGTFSATITLQYSVGDPGDWIDAPSGSYTAPVSLSYDDTLDNQIIYYRIGIKAGAYTSGTANAVLSYSSGSQTGVARVTGYTNETEVAAQVLTEFSGATATSDWSESYWSGARGYPSSVALYDGRLWWAGKDRMWGSVSDAYHDFDDETLGDAGPISRSIGSGPADTIHWALPLQRLVMGADMEVRAARSSSLDEPLTPTNFNLKSFSSDGSENVPAVKIGTSGIYVSGTRFFEAAYDPGVYDYTAVEISQLVPEIGEPGIVRLGVQHKPERRIHAIRSDGTVAMFVYMKQEDVSAWIDIETDGEVEDVAVLPGTIEDEVYYTVKRTINGSTVRYHEKWAQEAQCRGFPEARLSDAHLAYSGMETTTIANLSHLEGESVVVWGWNTSTPFVNNSGVPIGRDMGTFTVSGGQITGLSDAVTNAIVGIPYSATFGSTKLAYAAEKGSALCQKKRVAQLGLIARWLHADGVQYGPSLDYMQKLPAVESAFPVGENEMRLAYDEEMFEFPGEWDTDCRLFLTAASPRPATILAAVMAMEGYAK